MKYKFLFSILMLAPAMTVLAQNQLPASAANPVVIVLISIIAILACVILVLGRVMMSGYPGYKKKMQEIAKGSTTMLILFMLLVSPAAFAQETASPDNTIAATTQWIEGLSNTATIFILLTIALELIIIFYMVSVFKSFTRLQKAKAPAKAKKKFNWLEKLNNTKSVDEHSEASINLGHNYDGIEELDNPTPPWWQWAFILSAIFGVIYIWVYFVSYSAPNQFQELEIANAKAEEKIKAYMANSANKIDETTVKFLEGETDIAEGKKIFTSVCAACHGSDGGGIVGPNLTDNYWLHGGTINNIFKTIKYGVPEKGMKSWKDDYTPKQIAQLASFITTLKGTKPANPKDPEGDLFEEEASVMNIEQ